jgi:hypothetical protein
MNRFPHDRGQLRDKYVGGGRDGDGGKVVGVGGSGGGDRPRKASSTLSGSSRFELLTMTERTHNIRANQAMTSRVANTNTKIVGASGTKTMEVVVGSTKDISGRDD